MHEELLALLSCDDDGCRSCGDSPACREHFGNDGGRYWTASSRFNEAFVVDLGRGVVDRIAKGEPQRVRCKRR